MGLSLSVLGLANEDVGSNRRVLQSCVGDFHPTRYAAGTVDELTSFQCKNGGVLVTTGSIRLWACMADVHLVGGPWVMDGQMVRTALGRQSPLCANATISVSPKVVVVIWGGCVITA